MSSDKVDRCCFLFSVVVLCVCFVHTCAFASLVIEQVFVSDPFSFPMLRECAFGTGSLLPQAGQREQGSAGL